MDRPRIAITGAAGNLGSLLADRFLRENVSLNLLIHKKDVRFDLRQNNKVKVFAVDLNKKESLHLALNGVDTLVHFAGVLFKADPEKFLPVTNTLYFNNLLEVAVEKKVKRVILASFPHVEGESSPESPATGSLDKEPVSMHAKTRLEEEKLLFEYAGRFDFEPVSLRIGMVYGRGVLMIDVAQWFARHYLLGVWKKPTSIHLISKVDFVEATAAACLKGGIRGIYHLGDEGVQSLQEFLDTITRYKGYKKPWRMPVWMILSAARFFELWSRVFHTRSPLTVDFIKIGMVSYYGDTGRMRKELLPKLRYATYKEGLELF